MKSKNRPGRAVLRQMVFAIDTVQRRRHHVYDYDPSPKCVLRVSVLPATEDRTLSDGATVHRGDLIAEIHYHNENIAAIGNGGEDNGWGLRYYAQLRNSLRSLARHLTEAPECEHVVAVWAEATYSGAERSDRYREYFQGLGFEFIGIPPPRGLARVQEYFLSLYVWALIWAANPASLRGRPLRSAEHARLWMSRAQMLQKYGVSRSRKTCLSEPDCLDLSARASSVQIPADAH